MANADRRPGGNHACRRGAHVRRRARGRRRLPTLVLAATALIAPHPSKPPKPRANTSISLTTAAPRLAGEHAHVRPDPRLYEPLILEAALAHRLDPALIRGVIRFESAFAPLAVSPAGAQGLMQLMPAVAAGLGVRDIFDPRENIMGGARYLRQLLDRYHGRVDLASPATTRARRRSIATMPCRRFRRPSDTSRRSRDSSSATTAIETRTTRAGAALLFPIALSPIALRCGSGSSIVEARVTSTRSTTCTDIDF